MDISLERVDGAAIGSLFQQIMNDMKVSFYDYFYHFSFLPTYIVFHIHTYVYSLSLISHSIIKRLTIYFNS